MKTKRNKVVEKRAIRVKEGRVDFVDSMDYDVKFWDGSRYEGVKIDDFLNTIIDLNKEILNKDISKEDILVEFAKQEWGIEEIWNENLSDCDRKAWDYDFGLFTRQGKQEIFDIVYWSVDKEDYDVIAGLFNCKFDTVGYSPWAYYLAWDDVDENFITDLYEGFNWYDIEIVDSNGVIEDSLSDVYIVTEEDLVNTIKDNFGISKNKIYLIKNDITEFMGLKKVREVRDITYSYELV